MIAGYGIVVAIVAMTRTSNGERGGSSVRISHYLSCVVIQARANRNGIAVY
jgi:hypothetical protein